MICMARKHIGEEVYKSRLWEIKRDLNYKSELMWSKLKLDETDMSLEAFRNYFYRVPPDWLIEKAEALLRGGQQEPRTLISKGHGVLKVIGSVGAGGHVMSQRDDDELSVPIEFSFREWRGMVINSDGGSMMPYLHPGDTIVIQPQQMVKLGKFMVIRNEADPSLIYVKKAGFEGKRFVFQSLNPDYDDILGEGYLPIGYVVGIISADERIKIGPVETGIDEEFIRKELSSRLPDAKM